MDGYTKWEWQVLKTGLFSMMGLAMPSMLAGFLGAMLGNRTILFAGAWGMVVATVIGAATVITLRIMANRSWGSRRR